MASQHEKKIDRNEEVTASDDGPLVTELNLDQFLPYLLSRLADNISDKLSEIYEKSYDLNVTQWRVLAWLSHKDELTSKEICERSRMDKGRVSRAIQALCERGLIRRIPSNRDKRVHYLALTVEGKNVVRELVPAAYDWETKLVETLTVKEFRALVNIIVKLERQLERMS